MSELRKDPIVGRWVNISFEKEEKPIPIKVKRKKYLCSFCEGKESETPPEIFAERHSGALPNSPGWTTRVVPSKSNAFTIYGKLNRRGEGIYDVISGIGAYEIIVETPLHHLSLKDLELNILDTVVRTWKDRIADLKKDIRFRYIFLYKKHIPLATSIYSHSYSRIIATPITPKRIKEELMGAKNYYNYKERCIWCDIIRQELRSKSRLILETENFISFAPYASKVPYEICIIPTEHNFDFTKISDKDIPDFSNILKQTLLKLYHLWGDCSYSFILHSAPSATPRNKHWETLECDFHWHLEIMPSLGEPYGFEMGSGLYINPTSPEVAAKHLREYKV